MVKNKNKQKTTKKNLLSDNTKCWQACYPNKYFIHVYTAGHCANRQTTLEMV